MPHRLEHSVLQILNQKGETAGTGFLVGERLAVTCAHVVQAAGAQPGGLVRVVFHLDDLESSTLAKVKLDPWSPVELDDIAFLELKAVPEGAVPVQLGRAENPVGHEYYTFGFPRSTITKGRPAHDSIDGLANARQGGRLLQLKGDEITYGMSGAPVLDRALDRVIGMITQGQEERYTRFAYATRAETLLALLPQRGKRFGQLRTFFGVVLALIVVAILGLMLNSQAALQAEVRQTAIAGTAIALYTPTPTLTLTETTTPTVTATPTATTSPTAAPTATGTPTPTVTPTLLPEAALPKLIDAESLAVLTGDLDLIRAIFTPGALRTDGAAQQSENAIAWYEQAFDPQGPGYYQFSSRSHLNFQVSVDGRAAVVVADSCGSYLRNQVKTEYASVQSDRWTFEQDDTGRWWVTEYAFNQPPPQPELVFGFEQARSECLPWAARNVSGSPQGQPPRITRELAYRGQGALRFDFDTAASKDRHGQVVAYNIPFQGTASAYVYVPADAAVKLEAGFFAQDSAIEPFGYHKPTQYTPLVPGKWTRVTWNVSTKGWKPGPLHQIGIAIHAKTGDYNGYVLIDDITILTR